MKNLLIIVLLLSSFFTQAAEITQESKFLVKSVDGTDLSSLAAPNVKVLPPHRKVAYASSLPSIADRDRVFKESGLSSQIESWDDFDKDSLYIKLTKKGSKAIDRILEKFPDLKRNSLESAQKLIEKEEQP